VICVWIHSSQSELKYNFLCENQFNNQKIQILTSSRINYRDNKKKYWSSSLVSDAHTFKIYKSGVFGVQT